MDKERVFGWTLERKEQESRRLIKLSIDKFGINKVGISFSGDKDSTVLLHLTKHAFNGEVPVPVLNIYVSDMFKEVYDFRDRIAREWHLDLRVFRNDMALKILEITEDGKQCSQGVKTEAIKAAIEQNIWDALITAARWDEGEMVNETYFSTEQPSSYTEVNPILHFREIDIWNYIRKYNVPYCELYDKGYKSLYSGREISQEKEEVMKRLKDLGYL